MCRLHSRASLLLFAALRMALCQSDGFVLSPLQQAGLAEHLYHDLRLPQVRPNLDPFWAGDDGQDTSWPLGRLHPTGVVPVDLYDAAYAFPDDESDEELMRTTLDDIEKDVAKAEDAEETAGGEEDAKEASEEARARGEGGGGGRSKRETDKGQMEGKRETGLSGPKRAPDFHSWGGKRSSAKNTEADLNADNSLWGGKRAPDFNSWGGKRAPAFHSWGGKRAPAFNSWGGKRAPEFNSWGGKRAPAFNSWGGKRAPAFNSWGGKRAPEFNSWGGKRATAFNSWGGKRAPEFNSWGGKRAPEFNSWGGKRAPAFNSWGGKRAPEFNSWGGKRAPEFNSWGGKRAPEFNSWGGKRSTNSLDEILREQNPASTTKEAVNTLLEEISENAPTGESRPWQSLIIKKRSAGNELDSPSSNSEVYRKSKAADFYSWGG